MQLSDCELFLALCRDLRELGATRVSCDGFYAAFTPHAASPTAPLDPAPVTTPASAPVLATPTAPLDPAPVPATPQSLRADMLRVICDV